MIHQPQRRVETGIAGLHVADASIMLVITSGTTNALPMMIGRKAALIAAEHTQGRA